MGLRDSGLLDASVPLDAAAADGGGGPDAPTYLVDGGPDAAVRDDGGWDSGLGMMVPCETNAECDASEYCARAECAGSGTCAPRPAASRCTALALAPVCACDGRSYDNACAANAAGTVVSPTAILITTAAGGTACLTPNGRTCCTRDADCLAAGISGRCVLPAVEFGLPGAWADARVGVCLDVAMCSVGVLLESGVCTGVDDCCWDGVLGGRESRAAMNCMPRD